MSEQIPATVGQIGILHPGQMGASVASALRATQRAVNWASQGRSNATVGRARQAGLTDLVALNDLSLQCQYIFSICPPEQSLVVAREVATTGFKGIYTDCNAVSPASSRNIARFFENTEISYVDGGIIGPPAKKAGSTRLYLSGQRAALVSSLFADSIVDAIVIDEVIGSASALKMAYAGWTKGSSALLLTQFALAQQQNVAETLLDEWALSIPGLGEQLRSAAQGSAPKAWRFVGEMREIADTLEESGLARQWFDGAAQTYERLRGFKNRDNIEHTDVIRALTKNKDTS